jgi:RimJ/RimL family protein N-acetyltransferase
VNLATLVPPLRGQHVELVPLEIAFAAELASAAAIDRATYGFTTVPASEESMARYIRWLLGQRDDGVTVPFAQRDALTGRLVGCTRFLNPYWWRGRDEPDEVEIGGTWLAADVQRTAINTEAKLLLLTCAFETLGVWRVAICTDDRNERSRQAIARLGATFEGVLRQHRLAQVPGEFDRPRDTAVFSILDSEWPAVRQQLTDHLQRDR